MAIDISRPHHTDLASAKSLIEDIARELATELSARYTWEADKLVFSRTGIRGHLQVDAENVYVFIEKSRFVPLSDKFLKDEALELIEKHFPKPTMDQESPPQKETTTIAPEDQPHDESWPPPPPPPTPEAKTGFDGLLGAAGNLTAGFLDFAQQAGQAAWKVSASLATGTTSRDQMETAGQRIKALRKQAGLSLEEVRKVLGLPDDLLLEDVEEGRTPLPLHLVHKLADLLRPAHPGPLLEIMKKAYAPAEDAPSPSVPPEEEIKKPKG